MPVLRLGLVDDQTLVREGLRRLLDHAPDLQVVLEAQDGFQAVAALTGTDADVLDVLLLDVRMPGLDGVGVLEALRAAGRLPLTLMLTTFNDDDALLRSMRLGARGFVLKDVSFRELLADIRAVAAGGKVVGALSQTHPQRGGVETEASAQDLTERERELLRLMVGGYSNRELAEITGLKEGTVKNYISSILLKLGVRDRTRAVLLALEQHLI